MDVSLSQTHCGKCGSVLDSIESHEAPAPPFDSRSWPQSKFAGILLYTLGLIGLIAIFGAIGYYVQNVFLMAVSLGFFLPALAYLNSLKREAKKHFQSVMHEAPDPNSSFLLYLRSFINDGKVSKAHQPIFSFVRSVEESVVAELTKIAPVYAIGRPNEHLPELGARRLYYSDDQWQGAIQNLADCASGIVMRVGPTDAVVWELEHIVQSVTPRRFALILARSDLQPESGPSAYDVFLDKTKHMLPTPLCAIPAMHFKSDVCVVLFADDWASTSIETSFIDLHNVLSPRWNSVGQRA